MCSVVSVLTEYKRTVASWVHTKWLGTPQKGCELGLKGKDSWISSCNKIVWQWNIIWHVGHQRGAWDLKSIQSSKKKNSNTIICKWAKVPKLYLRDESMLCVCFVFSFLCISVKKKKKLKKGLFRLWWSELWCWRWCSSQQKSLNIYGQSAGSTSPYSEVPLTLYPCRVGKSKRKPGNVVTLGW